MLVKMLMEIDPLSMRGLMVITMATISPTRRDVPPGALVGRGVDHCGAGGVARVIPLRPLEPARALKVPHVGGGGCGRLQGMR